MQHETREFQSRTKAIVVDSQFRLLIGSAWTHEVDEQGMWRTLRHADFNDSTITYTWWDTNDVASTYGDARSEDIVMHVASQHLNDHVFSHEPMLGSLATTVLLAAKEWVVAWTLFDDASRPKSAMVAVAMHKATRYVWVFDVRGPRNFFYAHALPVIDTLSVFSGDEDMFSMNSNRRCPVIGPDTWKDVECTAERDGLVHE